METVFHIRSETYAEKTRRLLSRQQIPYHVQRKTSAEGCTALFRSSIPSERIYPLLRANRIPFLIGE